MTWRKLRVLIDWLPEDSLTWTELRDGLTPAQIEAAAAASGGGHGRWRRSDHLLAGILHAIRIGDWHFVSANTPANQQGAPPPQPIPQPGLDNVVPISEEAADFMADYYERLRTNHGSVGEV